MGFIKRPRYRIGTSIGGVGRHSRIEEPDPEDTGLFLPDFVIADMCCKAGVEAHPEPCPWHGRNKVYPEQHEGTAEERSEREFCPACGCELGEEAHAPELEYEQELRNNPRGIVESWDIRDEFDSVRAEIRRMTIVASITFCAVLVLGIAYMLRIGAL